jgi:hypothetical protein
MAARRSQVLSRRFIFLSCCVKESEMKKKEKNNYSNVGCNNDEDVSFFTSESVRFSMTSIKE